VLSTYDSNGRSVVYPFIVHIYPLMILMEGVFPQLIPKSKLVYVKARTNQKGTWIWNDTLGNDRERPQSLQIELMPTRTWQRVLIYKLFSPWWTQSS
jgi:hypothetical protein